MGLLKRAKTAAEKTALEKRILALPAGEFPAWIEQSLYQIGRSLYDHGRDGGLEHINDAIAGAEAALELLREFKRRLEV